MDVSKYGATNLIDFYITLVGQNYTSQLCAIAGLAWIVYDYFITLDMEINLVWRRSGTKSKLLYLFTRYYGIAFLTYDFTVVLHSGWSVHFCKRYFYIMGLGGFILIGAVEVALQCRVYVLYECNKKLLWFNAIFCVLELTGMVTLFLIDVGRYSPLPTPPGMTGCWSENINAEWSLGIWLICLVYESWLSFLVAYKAYHNIKLYGFRSRVLTVIVRDSLLWFLMLAVCLLFMCISWTVFARSQPGLILVGLPLTHASATLGGTRLLLNLRAAYFDSQAMSGLSTTVATSPSAVWAKRSVNNAGVPVGDQDIEIAEIWLKKSSSLGEYDRTYGYGLGGQCSRQATSTSATRHDE